MAVVIALEPLVQIEDVGGDIVVGGAIIVVNAIERVVIADEQVVRDVVVLRQKAGLPSPESGQVRRSIPRVDYLG